MARRAVGEKAPPEVLEQWIVNHGYDKPRRLEPRGAVATRCSSSTSGAC